MAFILRPTITQTFLERAQATPDRVAMSYATGDAAKRTWAKITFRDFFASCETVSNALVTLGLAPGDRVALLSATRWEWSLFDMAVLGAHGVTVPIYPSNTREDVAYIVRHCEARVVVVESAEQLEKLLSIRAEDPRAFSSVKKIVCIETDAVQAASRYRDAIGDLVTLQALLELGRRESGRLEGEFQKRLQAVQPTDTFTICYTSGTTGIPKGAVLTHDSLMSVLEDAHAVWSAYLKDQGEVVLSFLPFSHILGRVESLALHVFGWHQAFAENLDRLLDNISQVRPTLLFAVPRLFEKAHHRIAAQLALSPTKKRVFDAGLHAGFRVLGARERGTIPAVGDRVVHQAARVGLFGAIRSRFGGRLRFVISGGAPLPKEVGEFFYVMGIPVFEGYGLTETCAPVTLNTPDHFAFGTVGRPLPEVRVKIAADGEVLIQSRKVFKEYYRDPATTAEVLRDGWFHTGDIGEIDASGYLKITGRKKDIIVTSAGKNIAPQKIEAVAASQPWINQFVVHGDRRHYLTALITLHVDQVTEFARQNAILYSAYNELIRHPKVIARTQQVVDLINKQLASYETIKAFVILPGEFTVQTGELTPSLKVRRNVVTSRYRSELDHLYPSP